MTSDNFILAHTFPAGKLEQSITSLTLVNNVAKTVLLTVPANKRWVLFSIKLTNPDDVGRTIAVNVYKEVAATNLINLLASNAIAASGFLVWPNLTVSLAIQWYLPFLILEEANTLSLYWAAGGASAGGTDADGIVVEYLELEI